MRFAQRNMLVAVMILPGLLAAAGARADAPVVASLPGWMAGCWLAETGEARFSEECWTTPRGAMMIGSGHMFGGERSYSFEHMRIVREGGTIVFIAQPGGAPPTRFAMDRQTPSGGPEAASVSFVNPDNDYPQRVTYRLTDGHLEAEIAMLDGSRPMRWSFRRS
ncbi:DUF6265 family protein [Sphingobium lignivorans]|uniref:DUF6265 domain-containing protein n=1 Tax=Sphingobium lignivorans TaxID=2735886 RepID=A0ABR6NEA6_9SPHN|nr:DUF6265 family protein [Sphingobium lignivorans]MBB5984564.1 hypothetical protein [Sphingobium lignivorans]